VKGRCLCVAAAILVVPFLPACTQRTEDPVKKQSSAVARTPWGHPDISGTWEDQDDVGVPLEKADGPPKLIKTQEEAFAVADARGGKTGAGPGWWYEVRPSTRTHQLIDPPDGKLPPLTPEAQALASASSGRGPADNNPQSYRDLSVTTRCISRGPAMLPAGYQYNNAYEITQTPDYVAIRHEMIHDIRVVPLDGRPHVSPKVRLWLGDPRGHWEGDTLVVETTNIHDQAPLPGRRGAGPGGNANVVMIERFTRREPNVLTYELTINNPRVYTKPWTLAVPMKSDPKYQIFEYACQEGNQAVINIVKSNRAQASKGRSGASSGRGGR
jgi:hypothetical protein